MSTTNAVVFSCPDCGGELVYAAPYRICRECAYVRSAK